MIKSEYRVIGVMSGTSLDGIDLVYVSFNVDSKWHFEIIHSETVSYNKHWIKKLKDLVLLSESELMETDKDYT